MSVNCKPCILFAFKRRNVSENIQNATTGQAPTCLQQKIDKTKYLAEIHFFNTSSQSVGEKHDVPIDERSIGAEKQSLEDDKTVVSNKKQLFKEKVNALQMSAYTKRRILKLDKDIGFNNSFFSRADIMQITGITFSPAGDLIKKMKNEKLIESIAGHGKGRYRFKA